MLQRVKKIGKSWRFYTVPGDPSQPYEHADLAEAAKTWNGDEYWKQGGGGTVWDAMAYDSELNLFYIGVGNGANWNREFRSPGGGDNLYLSSIVALNPDDGSYVWHYLGSLEITSNLISLIFIHPLGIFLPTDE